jgi:hypothetical protein
MHGWLSWDNQKKKKSKFKNSKKQNARSLGLSNLRIWSLSLPDSRTVLSLQTMVSDEGGL